MKLLGKFLLVLLALLIFASASLWILAKNIKPETIKQFVSTQITTLTHKKSQIDGEIFWQIFPRPGLKFSKIRIGDETATEDYFLTIDTLLLNLKITPLLRGHFIFSEINVDGLKLHFNKDSAIKSQTVALSMNESQEKQTTANQFAIEKLSLAHSQIIINKEGKATVFKNIQASMEQFNLQKIPFPIQLKARLTEARAATIAKANINFKGRLRIAPTLIKELQNTLTNSCAEGQLSLQDVLLNQFVIKQVNATVKTNNSAVVFNPLTLSLYGGESIGDMKYTLATQQLVLNQTATNLDGRQLVTALLGKEALSGKMDYTVHLTIPGEKAALENITGKGTLAIKDGELYHVNLNQFIDHIKEKLNSFMADKPALKTIISGQSWDMQQGNTPFKFANSQFQLQNGIMNSESLLLQTDKLQVNGQGSINLLSQELDATLKATLNNNSTDDSLQKIQLALDGYFPITASGTIQQPILMPDVKRINQLLTPLLIKNIGKPLKHLHGQLNELLK